MAFWRSCLLEKRGGVVKQTAVIPMKFVALMRERGEKG
jgi:hypothetical protein